MELINNEEIIRASIRDSDIYGCYKTDEGWMFDRRLSPDGIARAGINPRCADLDLIGDAILPIPEYLVIELGLER